MLYCIAFPALTQINQWCWVLQPNANKCFSGRRSEWAYKQRIYKIQQSIFHRICVGYCG